MARNSVGHRAGFILEIFILFTVAGWISWPRSGSPRPVSGMAQHLSRAAVQGRISCSPRLPASDGSVTQPLSTSTFNKKELKLESYLQDLYENETDGSREQLRAVFAEDLFLLRILQQRQNEPYYVSHQPESVTQFDLPSKYGVVGLLAHNDHSGRLFVQLKRGQRILLIYGNGCTELFKVTDYLKFQALNSEDPYTDFKDLRSGDVITSDQIFNAVYKGDRHLTFQTCIAAEGDPSWGRLFVIAKPLYANSSEANSQ